MSRYRKAWVKVPPVPGAKPGSAILRKPWAKIRWFTEEPELVEMTPQVIRQVITGNLVECDPPETGEEDDN